MTLKRPSRRQLRALCGEVHPDDGIDPRELARKWPPRVKTHRKAWQLCGQVAEALELVLSGQADDALRNLQVVSVEPAPDTTRLAVTVRVHPPSKDVDPRHVLEHLALASGRLRCAVGESITRRRVPALSFRLALPTTSW